MYVLKLMCALWFISFGSHPTPVQSCERAAVKVSLSLHAAQLQIDDALTRNKISHFINIYTVGQHQRHGRLEVHTTSC